MFTLEVSVLSSGCASRPLSGRSRALNASVFASTLIKNINYFERWRRSPPLSGGRTRAMNAYLSFESFINNVIIVSSGGPSAPFQEPDPSHEYFRFYVKNNHFESWRRPPALSGGCTRTSNAYVSISYSIQ